MVNLNSMATKSSLELMLDKLLQLDDQPKELLPKLPARPVSRARIPRSRKPLQLSEFQRRSFVEDDGNLKLGVVLGCNGVKEEVEGTEDSKHSKVILENGVSNIQKCYRAYQARCHYKELRRVAIALQSFARGENARRNYHHRSKMLRAVIIIQKHVRFYIERRILKEQKIAAIPSQCTKSREKKRLLENCDLILEEAEAKDQVLMPYDVVADLRKRVLRTEAKVREKEEENNALKMQLHEIDEKWKQYEEKMKSMEIGWQDQLIYVQKCLAGKKKRAPIITFEKFDSALERYNRNNTESNIMRLPSGRRSHDFPNTSIDDLQHEELNNTCDANEDGSEQVPQNLHSDKELRNLKHKFKEWKKYFRNTLKEVKSTFKKLESAKSRRNWWPRFSR